MSPKANTREAYRLFHEGSLALARMEANGIRVDVDYLDRTIRDCRGKIKGLSAEVKADPVYKAWFRRYGQRTNLGSRTQLAEVVYSVLGHRPTGKTATGRDASDEEALERLDLPFVSKYLKLEKLNKALNTYLLGIRREVCSDGLLHPFFNLAGGNASDEGRGGAQSFRSSSSSPNFQNIPVRLEFLRNTIRRCFVPRDGHLLVEFDFKGIEVTIAACYHKDPTMLEYVSDKKRDMHRDTAMELFGLQAEEVSKEVRHIAKNKFVFPQFYGDFYASCAASSWEELRKVGAKVQGSDETIFARLKAQGIKGRGNWSPEAEKDYRPKAGTLEHRFKAVEDAFWNDRFPVYTAWKKRWYRDYLRRGYFDYFTGFRVGGPYKRNQVINYAVQGSAYHCNLWCQTRVQEWLDREGMRSLLVGQIHDSLLMDVHLSELDTVLEKVKRVMAKELLDHWGWIIAPLEVEVEVCPPGESWLRKGDWVRGAGGRWGEKQKPE